jgi:hypothetical protein
LNGGRLGSFRGIPEKDGCSLALKESITPVNDHTSKDLAGWHICLICLVIYLMDTIRLPMDEWENAGEYKAPSNE